MGLEEVGAKLVTEGESQFLSTMKKCETQTSGFGRTLSKVADGIAQGFGQALFHSVSKGIGMIPDLMKGALDATMEWGKGLDDIGDILGTSTKESAGLAAMFKIIGGDSNQLTSAMALMTKGLLNAKGELGPTGIALEGMGIKFRDAQGNILPATQVFQNVADKLGPMPEGLAKTSAMMDIFGKSGKEMGDALNAAANGGMDLYIRKAQEMGLVIDPEQIVRNNIAIETLKLAWTGLANRVIEKVLPIIEGLTWGVVHMLDDPNIKKNIDTFMGILDGMRKWLETEIPKAIDAVKKSWDNTFLPAIQTSWNWINDNVFKIAGDIYKWLYTTIPSAITFLKTQWETNFSAPLQTAWNWVRDNSTGVWNPVFDWINSKIPSAIDTGKAAWTAYQTKMGELVDYINGPVKTAFMDVYTQMQTTLPGATLVFENKILDLKWKWQDIVTYLNDYVVPIWNTIGEVITALKDKILVPLSTWIGGAFTLAWSGLAKLLNIDVSGAFSGLQFDALTPLVDFFNGPMRTALISVLDMLKSLKDLILNMPSLPSFSIPGIPGAGSTGSSGSGAGEVVKKRGEQLASGGSFVIPDMFGFEGFNMGGMATASAGERVTITPKNVSAGPSIYNYNYSTNYNLNLSTQQSSQTVQQSFAMMKMLAG